MCHATLFPSQLVHLCTVLVNYGVETERSTDTLNTLTLVKCAAHIFRHK